MRPDYCYDAVITRVIDGDTYDVEVDLGFRLVARLPMRLAHVDTPERFTHEGKVAIAFVHELLDPLPAPVVVRTYKPADKYGRYLADVYIPDPDDGPGEWLGAELLAEGLAVAYEGGTKGQ